MMSDWNYNTPYYFSMQEEASANVKEHRKEFMEGPRLALDQTSMCPLANVFF